MKSPHVAAAIAAAALLLSACGGDNGTNDPVDQAGDETTNVPSSPGPEADLLSSIEDGTITIGIKYDQPGLGLQTPDGSFTGFDVDVATYVAEELGVPENGITFVETKSGEREDAIINSRVDFIVATYSITDSRKEQVNFAGPYFIAHQDLLIRSEDTSITGPEAMSGKILCSVAGSTSAQRVLDDYAADVALQEYGTYTECVEALVGAAVDAVTTDDVILAGYAAQYPGQLSVVGEGFSDERYGIGLKKGDETGTEAINNAIQKMIDDGSWAAALEANVGPSGYEIPEPPTPGEDA